MTMTAETVFSIANMLALISWVVLLLAVWRKADWLRDDVLGRGVPLVLSVVYSALIVFFFFKAPGGFDTLANVQLLFTSPWAALAGWVHYLAFDLFLGCWIARQTMSVGLPRWPLVIILPLTFMFGPMGLLAFEACRFLLSSKSAVTA
jgi:Domain of unknown function (DUF4281)